MLIPLSLFPRLTQDLRLALKNASPDDVQTVTIAVRWPQDGDTDMTPPPPPKAVGSRGGWRSFSLQRAAAMAERNWDKLVEGVSKAGAKIITTDAMSLSITVRAPAQTILELCRRPDVRQASLAVAYDLNYLAAHDSKAGQTYGNA